MSAGAVTSEPLAPQSGCSASPAARAAVAQGCQPPPVLLLVDVPTGVPLRQQLLRCRGSEGALRLPGDPYQQQPADDEKADEQDGAERHADPAPAAHVVTDVPPHHRSQLLHGCLSRVAPESSALLSLRRAPGPGTVRRSPPPGPSGPEWLVRRPGRVGRAGR